MTKPQFRLRLRWAFGFTSAALLVATISFTVYRISSTSISEGLDDIKFNELTNESIKGRVEFSRSLFQVGLLITAGLWGLIIGKKDEAGIVFSDGPEILMFLSGSALLLFSLVDHSIYLHYVSSIYELGGQAAIEGASPTIPDVFDPIINNFYFFQIVHLVFGSLAAVVTLVSAHKLKETPSL